MPSSIIRASRAAHRRATSVPSTPRMRNTTARLYRRTGTAFNRDPQPPAAPVTPRTAPAAGNREDTHRGMPTFTSATITQADLVPVRLNEVNLRITPREHFITFT